jgi:hypothetical protein
MAFAADRPKAAKDVPIRDRAAMQSEPIRKGTALVPLAPAREVQRPAGPRAAFLAHLIATRRELPQTRARRRAEPDDAARAYRAQAARPAPRPVLSRSI